MDCDPADAVLRNPDILRLLFQELIMEDLCRVGAVCRQWRVVSQSDEFWASIDFSMRPIRQQQVLRAFCSAPRRYPVPVQAWCAYSWHTYIKVRSFLVANEPQAGGIASLNLAGQHLTVSVQWWGQCWDSGVEGAAVGACRSSASSRGIPTSGSWTSRALFATMASCLRHCPP